VASPELSASELIAPSRPGRAIAVAGGVTVVSSLALALVLSSVGSIPVWFLLGLGPLVGLSGWAVNGRTNDRVGVASAVFVLMGVPVCLYRGALGCRGGAGRHG